MTGPFQLGQSPSLVFGGRMAPDCHGSRQESDSECATLVASVALFLALLWMRGFQTVVQVTVMHCFHWLCHVTSPVCGLQDINS